MTNDKIMETREYGDVINEFLVCNKYFEINIFKGKNINASLLEKLNEKLQSKSQPELKNVRLTSKNTVISKSKNYVPEQEKLGKDYEWHSWNALTDEQVKKEKEYYLFAVKYETNEEENTVLYKCLLFDNNNFKEFLKGITMTANNRYFFYFAYRK